MYFLNEEQMASWYSLTFQLFSISFNLWPCFQRLFFFWRIGRSSTRGQNIGSSPVSTTSFTHPMNTSTSKKETVFEVWCFLCLIKNSKLLKSRPPGAARTANLTPSLHSVLLPQYSWRGWIFSFLQFLQPKKIFTTKKVSGQKILWTWGDPPTVKQSWNFSKWKVVQKWKEMQKFAEKLCFSQK